MSRPIAATTRRERRAAERATRPHARHGARRTAARRPGIGTLSLLGLVGGVVVIATAIAFGARPAATPSASEVSVAFAPSGLATDGVVIGSAAAPVTVDLYEDFQCPACELWGRTVFPLLAANEIAAGTVRVVFHDMTLIGPESTDAVRAGWAAAQQDRFWDMWATLYANQGDENSGAFSRDRLVAMADLLGLDVARFEADMDSSAASAALTASKVAAGQAGVTATPTVIIRGQALLGVRPYPELAAAIAAAAAASPPP